MLDVSYSDSEYRIQAKIFYFAYRRYFGLQELLIAGDAAPTDTAVSHSWMLSTPPMIDAVRAMAATLKDHWAMLCTPDSTLIDTLLALRQDRWAALEADRHQGELNRAYQTACDAFHDRSYTVALQALAPFVGEQDLSATFNRLLGLLHNMTPA